MGINEVTPLSGIGTRYHQDASQSSLWPTQTDTPITGPNPVNSRDLVVKPESMLFNMVPVVDKADDVAGLGISMLMQPFGITYINTACLRLRPFTYDHTYQKIREPVRSPIVKLVRGGLVVGDDQRIPAVDGGSGAGGLLCQQAYASRKLRDPPDPPIRFPTWCWAALGHAKLNNGNWGPHLVSLVELVGFPPVPQSSVQTDFTELHSRKLRIKAPRMRIYPDVDFHHNYKDDTTIWYREPPKKRIYKTAELEVDLDLGYRATFWIRFDPGSRAKPTESTQIPVFFGAMLLQDVDCALYGIILQKCFEGNEELYTREGTFSTTRIGTSPEAVEAGLWWSEFSLV
ncbi:hypothetical protein DER44DRAFT_857844 [Fusarium oxysporum]|nr:hypothetical protein DER44DRAFT_857844 [Fusarium oxysporum]